MNRSKLRECTFLLLFSNDFHEANELAKQFELLSENMENIEANEADKEYITGRAAEIVKNIDEIDKNINKVSVGWNTKRMSKVDLTILRLAYYEMKIDEDVPQKVAIDQAVELAKKYGSDESPSFINGILAKLYE
jgi:N utilization substance protein B